MKQEEADELLQKINDCLHGKGLTDFIRKFRKGIGGGVEDSKNRILIAFGCDRTGESDDSGRPVMSVECSLQDELKGKCVKVFKTTKSPKGMDEYYIKKIIESYESLVEGRKTDVDAKRQTPPKRDDGAVPPKKEGGFETRSGDDGIFDNEDDRCYYIEGNGSEFAENGEAIKEVIGSSLPWYYKQGGTLAVGDDPRVCVYCTDTGGPSFCLSFEIGPKGCLVLKAIDDDGQSNEKLVSSVYFKTFAGFAKCFGEWFDGLKIVQGLKEKMAKEKQKQGGFAGDFRKAEPMERQLSKPKVFGYVRVSTAGQNISRQKEEMLANGIAEKDLYIDYASGKDFDRPQYQAMKKALRKGDTVFFDSLDRLGRNYDEMKKEWLSLEYDLGVDLVCLDPKMMDTREFRKYPESMRRPIEDLILGILSWKSANERSDILRRQAQGIAIAKAKGKYRGRARGKDPEEFPVLCRQVSEGSMKAAFAMKKMGMTKATFFRHYADWKKANGAEPKQAGPALPLKN